MRLVHCNTSGPLPTSSFDLVADDGTVIGYCQIGHRPSYADDLPPQAANHVYYTVDTAHRGKGHGKVLLALVLAQARRIGLPAVRLTVDDSNPTSRHIIEGAGAMLLGEFARARGELCRLYEIRLSC